MEPAMSTSRQCITHTVCAQLELPPGMQIDTAAVLQEEAPEPVKQRSNDAVRSVSPAQHFSSTQHNACDDSFACMSAAWVSGSLCGFIVTFDPLWTIPVSLC
jgi:hypothetical protein